MIPVVGICGASGSGKTTLLEKLLPELKARGLKVGVLKHHGHGGPIETPAEWQGKDSQRLAQAGSTRVGLSHAGGVWLEASGLAGAGPRARAARRLAGMGRVIGAGGKRAALPQIAGVAPGRAPVRHPTACAGVPRGGATGGAVAQAGGVWREAAGLAGAGPRALAARLMAGMDLVIAEGFKSAAIPKIEVVAPEREPVLPSGGKLLALARRGGQGTEAGLPVVDADDPVALADFLLEAVKPVTPPPEPAKLYLDGQELPMNAFVSTILSGMLRGFVSSLKGTGEAEKIEVRLG
ncbi:MAG: molybdopterin-guanine dinucleotide biosynthesis protein MobB [Desulfarculus sp.]|nr:molybdopterin-guanine dinucleotide biosynthesis protein MobB [Desulfarculus sp.]